MATAFGLSSIRLTRIYYVCQLFQQGAFTLSSILVLFSRLTYKCVIFSLTFKVGEEPVKNFRMVERIFFRNQLVKSYDFGFGFCFPGSINTWDAIYDIPPLKEETIQEMIANPYETVSDSFYFVGNEMIMHNKARYQYVKEETEIDTSALKMEKMTL